MDCGVQEAVPNPAQARGLGDADAGLQARGAEQRRDIFGLSLLKESSDANSLLQEKAFLETLNGLFQQKEAATVAILAEAAPFSWIMMPAFFLISLIRSRAVIIHDDGTKQGIARG